MPPTIPSRGFSFAPLRRTILVCAMPPPTYRAGSPPLRPTMPAGTMPARAIRPRIPPRRLRPQKAGGRSPCPATADGLRQSPTPGGIDGGSGDIAPGDALGPAPAVAAHRVAVTEIAVRSPRQVIAVPRAPAGLPDDRPVRAIACCSRHPAQLLDGIPSGRRMRSPLVPDHPPSIQIRRHWSQLYPR